MKSVTERLPERGKFVHMQPQSTLNDGPKLFNGIEVRGIWREEQHFKPIFICNIHYSTLAVPGGIIHNQYTFGRIVKCWNQQLFQPTFKQIAIHRAVKRNWRYDLIFILGSHDTGSGKVSAADNANDFFSAWCVAIFSGVIFIKATFINIIQLAVFRQCLYFGNEFFSLLLVSFCVLYCVFFRVIFKTFFALRIPETLTLKATAVSLFVLYGFFR